jgi:hypothetical protein
MDQDRPFSGPLSVSLAGLTLLAIAGWSFGSGLSHELRVPRSEANAATVVVMPPKPAPPPASIGTLAYMAPPAEPAAKPPPPHRVHHKPLPQIIAPVTPAPPPDASAQPTTAEAAGADAAAVAHAGPSPETPPQSPVVLEAPPN